MPGAVSSWKAASFCKTILTHQKTLCSQFAWGKILCWPLLASCYWTQAQAGGFSVCSFVTTRINVQYTSFFYSEKPVLGVKEGKSMTRSRDSKGIASMRRDKWRDQWPKDNSTLAKSLFLSFEMSSLCLFSLLLSWTFFSRCYSPFYLVYPLIPTWILVSAPVLSPLNISCMKQKTIMFNRSCLSNGGIEISLRWDRLFFYSREDTFHKNLEIANKTKGFG